MTEEQREDSTTVVRMSRASTYLLLLGFFLTFLPEPWSLVALLPLGVSLLDTVRTVIALRRLGAPSSILVSNGVSVLLTGVLMVLLVLPHLSANYGKLNDCLNGANTQLAQQSCHDKYGSDESWNFFGE